MSQKVWRTILITLAFLATPFSAQSWNTWEDKAWRSIYESRGHQVRAKPGDWSSPEHRSPGHRNEHSELSEIALQRLGVADLFGLRGKAEMRVVDLNSRWLRSDLKNTETYGDSPKTEVEERTLPIPAQFSGLPDYSYTIYDWINKNKYCPPGIPPSVTSAERCHEYNIWLGAAFNSVHFGDQATRTYQHLHRIAVGLAHQARTMRERLWEKGLERERNAYVDYVKEAEIAALAYEGVAQHFLQDRWSTGHMWNRWNGGEYDLLAYKDWRLDAFVGMFSGVIHGTEYKTGFPDPMSGPWTYNNRKHPVTWSDPRGTVYGGIGDEHIQDLFYNPFPTLAKPSTHPAENVTTQRERLLWCSMSGWASVIRAFGRSGRGYGAWQAVLASDAPADDVVSSDLCWDNWATNFSIMLGLITLLGEPDFDPSLILVGESDKDPTLLTDPIERLKVLLTKDKFSIEKIPRLRALAGAVPPLELVMQVGSAALPAEGQAIASALNDPEFRRSVTQMFARSILWFKREPNGIGLARRRLGTLGRAESGDNYPLPSYLEPADLNELPDGIDTVTGRDKQSIFGFFNRAFLDYWSEPQFLSRTLDTLRGSKNAIEREVCQYLADRVYDGTDLRYHGPMKEKRRASGATGDVIRPVAQFSANPPSQEHRTSLPVSLHPGYVAFVSVRKPGDRTDFSYVSVGNWCDKIPVMDLLEQNGELSEEDIVAEAASGATRIAIKGRDFGSSPGKVFMFSTRYPPQTVKIRSWSDTVITISYADNFDGGVEDYCLAIETGGKPDEVRKSVGRFVLRITPESPPSDLQVLQMPEGSKLTAKLEGGSSAPYSVQRPLGRGECPKPN